MSSPPPIRPPGTLQRLWLRIRAFAKRLFRREVAPGRFEAGRAGSWRGFVGGRSFDDTIFKTNLEAAQVIARQLKLRNLGGIIIIDFIDMENLDHRAAVLAELNKALEKDRTRLTVNGFTQLGLVEMTRKRTRESLAHVLCETCPTCHGRGELKTAQTICYEILREILREAKQFNAREFRILAAQPVIDLFLDEESQSLAQLGDFIGKPISLQVESIYTQEQYDIVLI